MKIKNIAFTGFMAAILGATAAQAAAVPIQLISKTYAERELQAKLTDAANAGAGIAISEDGKISADMNTALVGEKSVATILSEKADASNVYTKEEAEERFQDVEEAAKAAKAATDYTNEKVQELSDTLSGSGEDGQPGLVSTVTAQGNRISALETLTGTDGKIAQDIAKALTDANAYTDQEVAKVQESVSTNAEAIEEITKVGGTIDAKVSAAQSAAEGKAATAQQAAEAAQQAADAAQAAAEAAQADVDAVEGRMGTAEGKISALETASATHALKTDLDAYRTSADQDVIDNAIKADVLKNETAISTLNAAAVKTIGAGQAGRYVIDFDAEGNASYTAIQIVQ